MSDEQRGKGTDMGSRTTTGPAEQVDTVVIGGGQAGLVMGHHLQRAGRGFVVLERSARVGDSWRRRYDSLRLFSPPRYASLPGMRIPTRGFPTRDEMADYLEAYVEHEELPVRTGVGVERVGRAPDGSDRLVVETTAGTFVASNVVVASGAHVVAQTPALAAELDPSIVQVHSLEYRNAAQLAPGGVLVVGAANSGTDLALEAAAAGHPTWIAGRHPGQVPVDIDATAGKVATPLIMFAFRHVLTLRTPIGRKMKARSEGHGVNLVRNKLADLDAAGVVRIGRITEVVDGYPVSADGIRPDVSTVLWCTGSGPDHSFLDLPVRDADGRLQHDRGVTEVPGLAFLGLDFQFAVASATIQGLDRDARHLMRHLRPAVTVSAAA
jgi:putative flavoprotein involved in K+ transport